MTTKHYYALKQQEKYNTIPLANNIKPFKYWVQVGIILLGFVLALVFI
jgi:hypothetical protein